jgi:hypothetical protein
MIKDHIDVMIKSVNEGNDPSLIMRTYLEQGPDTVTPDRRDMTPAEIAASFNAFADQMAKSTPYLVDGYVDRVVTQIKNGTSISDLTALAAKNRDQYASQGFKIDADGSFDTWDIIHRALVKTATDTRPSASVVG